MDDWNGEDSEPGDDVPPRPATEGVRILGAEEAAAAVQSAGSERLSDTLRFPTRPGPPEGVAPAATFPLGDVDPETVPRPIVSATQPPPSLPHWTEPPSGEVPSVLSSGRDDSGDPEADPDDLAAWSALGGGAPRWRDQHDAWDDSGYDDASVLAGDEPPLGALDERRSSPFVFDEDDHDIDSFAGFGGDDLDSAPIPLRRQTPPARRTVRPPRLTPRRTPPAADPASRGRMAPTTPSRDVSTAVALGVGIAAVALILFKLGPAWAMVLATTVVVVAAAELYDVLRRAGYQPATLVGLVGTLAIMIAAYTKGETALPLVTVLVLVASFGWYLIRVVSARPTVNIAATVMAFLWTGVLGSYAALILSFDKAGHTGVAFLLGAVLATVASDVGGFVVGSRMGSRPLAVEISPNKTWEGLIGGAVASVVVSVFLLGIFPHLHPWSVGKAFWLGLVVAVVAPLGDLAESMIKRDLGLKDMGNMLPGHGGVLDRFDALLFVLPATYYLLRVLYF